MKTRKNKCIVHTVQICYLTVYCFECMNTYIISTANVIPAKSTDYNGFTVLFMFNQLTRTIICDWISWFGCVNWHEYFRDYYQPQHVLSSTLKIFSNHGNRRSKRRKKGDLELMSHSSCNHCRLIQTLKWKHSVITFVKQYEVTTVEWDNGNVLSLLAAAGNVWLQIIWFDNHRMTRKHPKWVSNGISECLSLFVM